MIEKIDSPMSSSLVSKPRSSTTDRLHQIDSPLSSKRLIAAGEFSMRCRYRWCPSPSFLAGEDSRSRLSRRRETASAGPSARETYPLAPAARASSMDLLCPSRRSFARSAIVFSSRSASANSSRTSSRASCGVRLTDSMGSSARSRQYPHGPPSFPLLQGECIGMSIIRRLFVVVPHLQPLYQPPIDNLPE